MDAQKLRITLSIFNLVVIGLILIDLMLPPIQVNKIVKEKDSALTKEYKSRGYMTYFLIDKNDKKYNVPYDIYLVYSPGDSFAINQTKIFSKTISINYSRGKEDVKTKIGVVNGSGFGKFVIILDVLLSLTTLLFPKIFREERVAARTSMMAFWITVVIIVFYFFSQT